MVCRAGLSVEPRVCALDNRTLLRDSTFGHARQLESVLIDHLRRLCERVELLPGTDAVDLRVNRPGMSGDSTSWERRRTLRVLRGVGNRVLISPTICGPESTIGGCVSRPTPDLPLVL
jgi:hypothetical protein